MVNKTSNFKMSFTDNNAEESRVTHAVKSDFHVLNSRFRAKLPLNAAVKAMVPIIVIYDRKGAAMNVGN